ncbi:MAG: LysM peptidoglycan-binding domain-containing protein [Planctomycetes bacterium]|nr:LysM peptidoglycan-binding domain-containing protein [Planctomycetota bacterium]
MATGRLWSIGFLSVAALGVSLLFVLRHSLFRPSSTNSAPATLAIGNRPPDTASAAQKRRFDPDAETEVVFQIGGIRLPHYVAPMSIPPEGAGAPSTLDDAGLGAGDAKAHTSPIGRSASDRTYVVGQGDTLSVIAKRLLGSAARWKEIADLNGIEDPARLKIGQELRIP